jgi:hypothetical protein
LHPFSNTFTSDHAAERSGQQMCILCMYLRMYNEGRAVVILLQCQPLVSISSMSNYQLSQACGEQQATFRNDRHGI